MNKSRFITFTSANGGIGTSSIAVAFARTLVEQFGAKVLLFSLDQSPAKKFHKEGYDKADVNELCDDVENNRPVNVKDYILEDSFGVKYLNFSSHLPYVVFDVDATSDILLRLSFEYDYIVIDAPSNSSKDLYFLIMSEDVIVNYGYHTAAVEANNDFCDVIKSLPGDQNIRKFFADYDENSFVNDEIDLQSYLGAQVRRLVGSVIN